MARYFPDGVFFVRLARISEAGQMLPSVVEALGFRFAGGDRQQVLDYLREKRLLLVLDNVEHLAEGFDLVADILRAAPAVQVLATSRERLHLHEEQAYPIRGLAYLDCKTPPNTGALDAGHPQDAVNFPAAQLFLQAARRFHPAFALAEEEVAALMRICRQLEGMPLGINAADYTAPSVIQQQAIPVVLKGRDVLGLAQTGTLGLKTRTRSASEIAARGIKVSDISRAIHYCKTRTAVC